MKRQPVILILLLLAHVAVDLVAWRLAEQQLVGSPPQILLIALMRSQLSLLALYMALGTSYWAWRLGALASGVAVWTGAFLQHDFARLDVAQTATLFSLLVLPLVLIGALARMRGYLWGRRAEQEQGTLTTRQFSLGAAFRWLTITALLLGLAKMAEFPPEYGDVWWSVSLINAFVAIAFLWALASATFRLPKVVLMLIVAVGSTVFLQVDPNQAWVTKFVLQALLMAGTADVCRIAGWPLTKLARETNEWRKEAVGEAHIAVSD